MHRPTASQIRALQVALAVLATVALSPQRQAPVAQLGPPGRVGGPYVPEGLHRLVDYGDLRAVRTFFERVDVTSTAAGLVRPRPGASGPAAVARGLDARWEAPFELVRDGVMFVPYVGNVRGAAGALSAAAANALDQSVLLRSLLELRGVRARLVRGQLDWPAATRLVLGGASGAAPAPGDPWPRWVENAADHWWVQAQRDGEWVDLDPSFVDAEPGVAYGRAPRVFTDLPEDVRTGVQIELRRGDQVIAVAEYDAAAVVGDVVSLRMDSQAPQAVWLWIETIDAMRRTAGEMKGLMQVLGWLPRPRPPVEEPPPGVDESAAPPEPAPPQTRRVVRRVRPVTEVQQGDASIRVSRDGLERDYYVPEIPEDAGPWMAKLTVPGQLLEAGPFEIADLALLQLRVTVSAPMVPRQVLEVPWGEGGRGRIVVVVGAGRVSSSRLAEVAAPLYASLGTLGSIEQRAREGMRPPIAYHDAVESLRSAATEAWTEFSEVAPQALAWAALSGVDRVSPGGAAGTVARQGLRLAAVRWRPPGRARGGELALLLNDPITIGRLTGVASAVDLRAGYGLLQSAVLSQILNRLADRAPQTAFDMTLRAIGTGDEIVGFGEGQEPPEAWPLAARAATAARTREGYAVLGSSAAEGDFMSWWQVGVADGETSGWVTGPAGDVQGVVQLAEPVRADALDTLLASLPALHRAARWLAALTGESADGLSSVPPAACASAAVAAEPLAAGLPTGWPRPVVLALCVPD